MTNKFNNIQFPTHLIPVGYIALVCLGYFVKSIYYQKFDIEIENYLNFQEYLFIFLPIGSGIIVALIAITAFFGGLYVITTDFVDKNPTKEKLRRTKPPSTQNDWKIKNKVLRFLIRAKDIFQGVLIFSLFFGPIILLLYYGITKDISGRVVVLTSLIWGFSIMSFYFFGNLRKEKEPWKNLILLYAFLISMCPMIIDIKMDKADLILSGDANKSVKLLLQETIISTNDSLIYIGQTKDFLFLRDLKANGNHIYNKKDIKELIFTDLRKDKRAD
ncbi:hypothetical protein DZC72_14225 [Maribacter algicola]|uniref:Uncharacterized protein n=1 Tax=Maribacter algicola TaxID=2498892 RepID=A0A426RIG6_9FLAO|nr:hypothetical protein [Maribacter algicola]RRQ48820.1 hypothetical protein DZC72_14225 [Maribacter algicola]